MDDFSHALSKVHKDWFHLQDFSKALKILEVVESNGTAFAPSLDRVLSAYALAPEQVRVVLVGQDPYPTLGDATGLAFSVERSTNLPRSLRNIFTELASDTGKDLRNNGNLQDWHEQGVFLINRTLTVPIGNSNGHQDLGWENFTNQTVSILGKLGAVGLLMGKSAGKLSVLFKKSVITAHPSPLSANRGFFGSRPFSKVNELLDKPIEW